MNKIDFTFLFLIVFFVALRFFAVEADSASFIDFSNSNFTDEGYKTDFARETFFGQAEKVFLGSYCKDCAFPNPTSTNNFFVNNVFLSSFVLFGQGFFSIRLVAIVLSLSSLALFCIVLHRFFGLRMALVTGALLASSFVFFSFNRLALLENFVLFFVCLSFFVFVWFKNWFAKLFALALLLFGFFCKFSGSGASTVVSSGIPNELFLVVRDYAIMGANRVFRYSLVLYAVGLFSLILFLKNRKWFSIGSVRRIIVFNFVWFVGGMLTLGFFTYQPSRYFYLLLPPLAFFAGYLFCFGKGFVKLRTFVFVGLLFSQFFLFGVWLSDLHYSQYDSSKEFANVMNSFGNPVVAGTWCPVLAVESSVLCQRGSIGVAFDEGLLVDLNVGFLVAEDSEWQKWESVYGSYELVDFVFVKEFQVHNSKVFLFEIERS